MDIKTLLDRQVVDEEALIEFADALDDHLPDVERTVAELRQAPGNKLLLANLFRALHTIKGDAALCKLSMGEQIAHPIETLLGRMRDGEIPFSETLSEAIMLAMDRLELATKALLNGRSIDHLKLVELVGGFEALAEEKAGMLESQAASLIETVTGFHLAKEAVVPVSVSELSTLHNLNDDLQFFRSLALQYESRSPLFEGRSERQLKLALETNEAAGNLLDPLQLTVAVYLHDIGMLFLPEPLWLKGGRLTDEERSLMRQHPGYAAGLLERMENWSVAAKMVLQHHERQDGTGYPRGLKANQIVPGAKLLSILDTFESVILKHSQYGKGRSLIRAIAEVNASDDQFAPEWIASFNVVIRRMVEG